MKFNRLVAFISIAFLFNCSSKPSPKPEPVTEYFHVTFDAEGGTPAPEPQEVEKNHCVVPPEINPEKEGVVFKYWHEKGEEGAYEFSTPVTRDLTLEAEYNNLYRVTFETFGEELIPDQIVEEDHYAIRPEDDPTREGSQFEGWYYATKTGVLDVFNFEEMPIKSDITLYAKFDQIYLVSFETNGGTEIPPVEVAFGSKLIEPDTPKKGVSMFAGWYKEKELINQYDFNAVVDKSFTLFAKWEDYWLVDLYAPGAIPENQLMRIKDGDCITNAIDPTYPDYEFKGWHYTQFFPPGEKPIDLSTTHIESNLILFAGWDIAPRKVTFKYSEDDIRVKEVSHGDYVDQPEDPIEVDSYFDGWYLDDELFDFNTPITKDITLKAHYKGKEEAQVELKSSNTLRFKGGYIVSDTFITDIELNGVDDSFYRIPNSPLYYDITTSNGKHIYDRCSIDTSTGTSKLVINLKGLTSVVHVKAGEVICKYLSFTGIDEEEESTITFDPEVLEKSGGKLKCSAELTEDASKWRDWKGGRGKDGDKLNIKKGETYYIRGANDHLGGDEVNRFRFLMTGKIKADGDVTCLRNFSTKKLHYEGLFADCDSLITSPQLPLTTLGKDSYAYMFNNCINLIEAPVLPAINIGDSSYTCMFKNCPLIKKTPYLPATNVRAACYDSMFSGCISLTRAFPLAAKNLADGCYSFMFYGCNALAKAPQINATSMKNFSCEGMFKNCSSLRHVSDLQVTDLGEQCCSYMFAECISLEIAPRLPAEKLARGCYYYMFDGCTHLRSLSVGFNESSFDKPEYTNTSCWLQGVKVEDGIFKWKGSETYDERGVSTIPVGWSIETEI